MHASASHKLPFIGIAAFVFGIQSGCSNETQPPKATYTVEEYLAKPDVLKAKLEECTNNPGELRNHPDCINVKAAAKQNDIGSYSKLKPLEFPLPDDATDNKSTSSPQ
jgi:hypothetical protein